MKSRDYRKEVGLPGAEAKVAWPIAAAVCAVCAGIVVWAIHASPSTPVTENEAAPAKTVAKR
ncbi:MAG: hypothetical protein HYV95_12145 [Opitutae bacterium]|nr:hypothetical protein [Opitutae bacterium]